MGKKLDKINIGISALSLVLAVIAIIVAYNAIKSNEYIAKESGAFDKPIPALSFGNYVIPSNLKDNINLMYGVEFNDSTVQIAELPLRLANIGNLDLKDIKVTISFNKNTGLLILDTALFHSIPPSVLEINRHSFSDTKKQQVIFEIESLTPGVELGLTEPIHLINTTASALVSRSKQLEVQYQIQFEVSVMANNVIAQVYKFGITIIESKSHAQLMDEYVANIDRSTKGIYSCFTIYPKEILTSRVDSLGLRILEVRKEDINYTKIDISSEFGDLLVPIYDGSRNLKSFRVYNEFQEFKKELPAN